MTGEVCVGWLLVLPLVVQTLPSNIGQTAEGLAKGEHWRSVPSTKEELPQHVHKVRNEDDTENHHRPKCPLKVNGEAGLVLDNLQSQGVFREYEIRFLEAVRKASWEAGDLEVFAMCPRDEHSAVMKLLAGYLVDPQGKYLVVMHLEKEEWAAGSKLWFQGTLEEHILPLIQHHHSLILVFYSTPSMGHHGSRLQVSGDGIPQEQVACVSVGTRYLVLRVDATVRSHNSKDIRLHLSLQMIRTADGKVPSLPGRRVFLSACRGHSAMWVSLARVHELCPSRRVSSICARTKKSVSSGCGLLVCLSVPSKPCASVAVDFIVESPSSSGHKTILIVVDRLTKMAHFIPLANLHSAAETASAFIKEVDFMEYSPEESSWEPVDHLHADALIWAFNLAHPDRLGVVRRPPFRRGSCQVPSLLGRRVLVIGLIWLCSVHFVFMYYACVNMFPGFVLSDTETQQLLFGIDDKCMTKMKPALFMIVGKSGQPGASLPFATPSSSSKGGLSDINDQKKDEFLETLSKFSSLLLNSPGKATSTIHISLDPTNDSIGDLHPHLFNVTDSEALEWLVEAEEPLVFLFLPGSKSLLGIRDLQGKLVGTLLEKVTNKLYEVLEDLEEVLTSDDHIHTLKRLLNSCHGTFNISYLPTESETSMLGENQHRNLHSLMLLKALQTVRTYWQDRKKLSRQNRGAGIKPHCRLQELTINLKPYAEYKDVHFPEEININNCVGPCRFPQTTQSDYQAHVILLIQLQERKQTSLARPPCCVPVKYQEQWLMIVDENGLRLQLYPNMVAKECGCR
ncbi:muellerian-inhibiting factor [Bombina bombina]|uniref:muellerian-inhibiting factor n=1 Tax=Bombina bombina TaxID=8345 RepID=UPI00235A61E2|nr:muellerian-inhibiting factor [Bombina bombina]